MCMRRDGRSASLVGADSPEGRRFNDPGRIGHHAPTATAAHAARPCTGPPRSRAPWMLDARPSCANPIVVLESVSLHRPPLGRLPFSRSRVRAAPCYVLLNPIASSALALQ